MHPKASHPFLWAVMLAALLLFFRHVAVVQAVPKQQARKDELSSELSQPGTDASQTSKTCMIRWFPLPCGAEGPSSATASFPLADKGVTIRVLDGGVICEMNLHDYLMGVVAAEMPAVFGPEALKAQAVASRSCTLYHVLNGNSRHPQAAVCTDSGCCQAYRSPESLQKRWGDDYEANLERIREAVEATDGLCLFYNGSVIYAPYHSSSEGATENSGAIWSETPYLVSVFSPEDDTLVPNFHTSITVTRDELQTRLRSRWPEADLSGEWEPEIRYTASGRAESVTLGNICLSGPELRRLLGLRSTRLDVRRNGDEFSFSTGGWGHGVGMSQYGAQKMALDGSCFEDILLWYYSGVRILPCFAAEDKAQKTAAAPDGAAAVEGEKRCLFSGYIH